MSPEIGFSLKSRRVYKALCKKVRDVEAPKCVIIIPGRERPGSGRPERVYVEVLPRNSTARGERYYFKQSPKRSELQQIIDLLVFKIGVDSAGTK